MMASGRTHKAPTSGVVASYNEASLEAGSMNELGQIKNQDVARKLGMEIASDVAVADNEKQIQPELKLTRVAPLSPIDSRPSLCLVWKIFHRNNPKRSLLIKEVILSIRILTQLNVRRWNQIGEVSHSSQ